MRPATLATTTLCFLAALGFLGAVTCALVDLGARAPRVIIVTSLPEAPCHSVTGLHVQTMALKNKQEYADLHTGYQLQWTRNSHPELAGPWNKVKVILDLLLQYSTSPQPPWLLWVDADAIFANMSRTIPLDQYAGKDIVIPGDQRALDEADAEGVHPCVKTPRHTTPLQASTLG